MVSISVWGGKQRVQGVAENCHADAEKIQAQKVELPIPGVMIAPDHAEQKQRIRNAADTAPARAVRLRNKNRCDPKPCTPAQCI